MNPAVVKSKKTWVVVVVVALALSGCGRRESLTFEVGRMATIRSGSESEQFGTCWPGALDGRGAGLLSWDGFLRYRERDGVLEGGHLAGYEITVQRGESCHQRTLVSFQSALWLDLSTIPEGAAVESAVLNINDETGIYRGDVGTECELFMLGEAEESWAGGVFYGPPSTYPDSDGERAFILNRSAHFDAGPHTFVGEGLDVSKTVADWVLGTRPNRGFTITPDPDRMGEFFHSQTEEGRATCETWMLGATLEVAFVVGGS